MAKAPWTAPPRWLRLFNKVNIDMQGVGIPLGPTQPLTLDRRASGAAYHAGHPTDGRRTALRDRRFRER
jgi:hypothetical protein